MNKQHILFLISDMGPGGAQRVASILCSHWIKCGHKVTLVTFEAEGSPSFYDLDPAINKQHLGVSGRSANLWEALCANISRLRNLRQTFVKYTPDNIVSFMPENNILALISAIGLPCGKRVFISERNDPLYIPNQKIWRILRRMVYPLAHSIICQTSRAADFFTYHGRVEIIANPLPPPPSYDEMDLEPPPKPFISALGRLIKKKGFDVLLEAFVQIRQDFPSYSLVIIGEGSARNSLEKQIINLGLQNCVFLPGTKKHPFSILKESALFVMPSRLEGFPNALCEAMAHGLPVIASDAAAGAIPVVKDGENAVIIPTDDVKALAFTINDLLSNPKKSVLLGENARLILKDLAPDKICVKWDKIMET